MTNLLDRDDLLDLDMGEVAPKELVTLPAGKYLFSCEDVELKDDEDKEGNHRLVMIFKNKVVEAVALDKDYDGSTADLEGQFISERFYSPTTDNIGYVRKYMDNVLGAQVEAGTPLRKIIETLSGSKVRFIGRVTNRKYQDRVLADLSRDAKHFTGFEHLDEKYVS